MKKYQGLLVGASAMLIPALAWWPVQRGIAIGMLSVAGVTLIASIVLATLEPK